MEKIKEENALKTWEAFKYVVKSKKINSRKEISILIIKFIFKSRISKIMYILENSDFKHKELLKEENGCECDRNLEDYFYHENEENDSADNVAKSMNDFSESFRDLHYD